MQSSDQQQASTNSAADAWAFYHLPIFYTLQPNPPTRQKQISFWADILVHSALRQCSLAHEGVNAWEHSNAADTTNTTPTSSSPPSTTRALPKGKLTGALPTDKCPYAVLFTVDDDIFANASLNRRLPKAAAAMAFQAAMMMYPTRCISNVPLTTAMSAPGDESYYSRSSNGKAVASPTTADGGSGGGGDQFGSWLSSVFSRSSKSSATAPSQQQQQTLEISSSARSPSDTYWLVVFANEGGHVLVMSDHIMPWVMDVAGGLTTANLKKNGVITTFDEMCSENALTYTAPEAKKVGLVIAYYFVRCPAKGYAGEAAALSLF